MAKNMESAAKEAFPNASLVTDRFHVVKLAIDALQHIRVKLRWKELDKENRKIAKAKSKKVKYKPKVFSNGDTPKQLLARSKFILNKKPFEWTASQKLRAKILFDNFPVLENAYQHIIDFRAIYDTKFKNIAKPGDHLMITVDFVEMLANAAFMKAMTPSAALAAIVGASPLPRTEVTKKVWEYIKKNKLQDAANKRMINADAKLKEIFKKAQASMFEMTKMINEHLK